MQALPPVGRIQGVELRREAPPQGSAVSVQYSSHNRDAIGDYELVIPYLDALYLLNALRAIEDQSGFGKLSEPTR